VTWKRRKILGYALIWMYWTSFAWLPVPFRVLGIQPRDHPWLTSVLEIHYAPFMAMLPQMAPLFTPILGWSMGLIWSAPILVILVGGICCSGLWWVTVRVLERRKIVGRSMAIS
jgi:hypothetical protein